MSSVPIASASASSTGYSVPTIPQMGVGVNQANPLVVAQTTSAAQSILMAATADKSIISRLVGLDKETQKLKWVMYQLKDITDAYKLLTVIEPLAELEPTQQYYKHASRDLLLTMFFAFFFMFRSHKNNTFYIFFHKNLPLFPPNIEDILKDLLKSRREKNFNSQKYTVNDHTFFKFYSGSENIKNAEDDYYLQIDSRGMLVGHTIQFVDPFLIDLIRQATKADVPAPTAATATAAAPPNSGKDMKAPQ